MRGMLGGLPGLVVACTVTGGWVGIGGSAVAVRLLSPADERAFGALLIAFMCTGIATLVAWGDVA
jgi:hypothetical protein